MSAIILQQIAAGCNGVVYIKAGNRTGRSGNLIIGFGKYNSRFIIVVYQPGGHNTYYSFMPVRPEEYRTVMIFIAQIFLENQQCFIRNTFIDQPAVTVILMQLSSHFLCGCIVLFNKEGYCFIAVIHSTGSIDAGSDDEDQIGDLKHFFSIHQFTDHLYGQAWIKVHFLHPKVCQYTVFSVDGYNVRSDRSRNQIEIIIYQRHIQVPEHRKTADQFETDATTAQFFERIRTVSLLRIEDG
ncbi:hypothetical protein D9M68_730560 [compost metagenome]